MVEVSTHQRKLLLVSTIAIAATLIAILGLDWFRARMNLPDGSSARLEIGLRTLRTCVAQHCEAYRVGSDSSFGLFATFTFWVGVVFAITLAIQTGCKLVLGRALDQPMTTIGIMLGVMVLGGLIVCGLMLAPSGIAGAVTVHRTWAMTLLFAGVVAGLYTLHLASTDDITPNERPPLVEKPVFVSRARPALAETDGIALEPEAVGERDPFLPDDNR